MTEGVSFCDRILEQALRLRCDASKNLVPAVTDDAGLVTGRRTRSRFKLGQPQDAWKCSTYADGTPRRLCAYTEDSMHSLCPSQ